MLTQQQLEQVEGFEPFRFRELKLIEKQYLYDIYKEINKDRLLRVMRTQDLQLLKKINNPDFEKTNVEILGYLRKKDTYYIFMEHEQKQNTLKDYIQKKIEKQNKPYLLFKDIQILLNFLIHTLQLIQLEEPRLTILSPKMIIVQEYDKNIRFKYNFPLEELFIDYKSNNHVRIKHIKEHLQFASPELVKQLMLSNNEKININYKQVIFSMALVILFSIFGETFSVKDRLRSVEDRREFQSEIKFKRKQIKTYFNEKTISKTLKILLQRDEGLRDDFSTLKIKLGSRQFNQEPEKILENKEKQGERLNTIQQGEHMFLSAEKKTISLYLSKNAESIIMKTSKNTQILNDNQMNNYMTQREEHKIEDVQIRGAVSIEQIQQQITNLPMNNLMNGINHIKMFDQVTKQINEDKQMIEIKQFKKNKEQQQKFHPHNIEDGTDSHLNSRIQRHNQSLILNDENLNDNNEDRYHYHMDDQMRNFQRNSKIIIIVVIIVTIFLVMYDLFYIK